MQAHNSLSLSLSLSLSNTNLGLWVAMGIGSTSRSGLGRGLLGFGKCRKKKHFRSKVNGCPKDIGLGKIFINNFIKSPVNEYS